MIFIQSGKTKIIQLYLFDRAEKMLARDDTPKTAVDTRVVCLKSITDLKSRELR